MIFFPAGVAHEVAADDFYRGKQKMTLRFELPRGAYATILVKRVTVIIWKQRTPKVSRLPQQHLRWIKLALRGDCRPAGNILPIAWGPA